MFQRKDGLNFRNVIEGIERSTMVHGEKTLMTQFKLQKGADLPAHEHMHEQTGLLISGRIVLNIDGVDHDAVPGDSWCIGADVPHGARALEDSVAVEVFSPVREDYLEP